MSFILDALKKLEQKSQQYSIPDLMTVHTLEPREPKKSLLWIYLLLVSLLLNAVILTAWLRPWESEEKIILAKSSTKQEKNSPIVNLDQKDFDDNEENTSTKVKTIDKKSVSEHETVAAEKNMDTTSNTPQNHSLQAETDEHETIPNKSLPIPDTTSSLGLNPTAKELEILRNKIKKEQQLPANNYSSTDYQPTDINKIESEQGILELSQLPSDIRKELPDISITGHIYSNNSSSRIVNINGRIIREGDNVTPGLKVEEITISGVILNYQGFRFIMRAF